MTDRELLELAAKAAGIVVKRSRLDDPAWKDVLVGATRDGQETFIGWNPLTDDGDALRLGVKLKMLIGPADYEDNKSVVSAFYYLQGSVVEVFVDDECAATRRAIVRIAAEIGRRMK